MPAEEASQDFDELLLMLKETRGFDFTGYKRSTLMRRVRRRMDACKVATLGDYRDHLELEPEEFSHLFDSLLINVTGFFRDPPAWESLREQVLPELLSAKSGRRPLRVWSAGCATGEEAYTLAIVLAETVGIEDFLSRVKIYATDLDEEALAFARAGVYSDRQVSDVSEALRQKYFEPSGTRYAFRRDLRRQVIFGRTDLTRDAPISRVGLLVARNTLMYFNAETQSNILRKFHFALCDPGFLFLGKAEMLLGHSDEFEPVDPRKRLFRKIPRALPAGASRLTTAGLAAGTQPAVRGLEAAALAAGPVAQLVVDRAGRLAAASVRAESLFGLQPRDIGRLFQDLEVSYRPVELRSIIEHVTDDQRPVELTGVIWQRSAGAPPGIFDISVVPLYQTTDEPVGVGISFLDVTRHQQLRDELERSNHDLEHAYEELETTSEELQSTNEELETTNEELQSTNDELQVINDALQARIEELGETRSFLGTVLRSLGTAVMVVGNDLRVTVWSPGSEDLWGVRADEATGRLVTDLDVGLPVAEIVPLLRQALTGGQRQAAAVVSGTNRRGRQVRMRAECRRLLAPSGAPVGAMLVLSDVGSGQPG